MEKNNKKKGLLIIVLAFVTLAISVGGTYAYFEAQISQGVNSRVSVTAISGLTLSFDNGNGYFNFDEVMPGNSWNKQISVTLNNKKKALSEMEYSIIIHITDNGFNENTGYLEYKLTSTSDNINPSIDTGFVKIKKKSGDEVILRNQTIAGTTNDSFIKHTYNLTLYYPNYEDTPQEQGGYFDGYLYVTDEHQEDPIKSFTLNNHTYYYETGMTWGDWVESDYNENYVMRVGGVEYTTCERDSSISSRCVSSILYDGVEYLGTGCNSTVGGFDLDVKSKGANNFIFFNNTSSVINPEDIVYTPVMGILHNTLGSNSLSYELISGSDIMFDENTLCKDMTNCHIVIEEFDWGITSGPRC